MENNTIIWGYCRVSTKKQSIERQVRNITKEYPEAKIIQEAYTGTKINRPKFDKMLKQVIPGDTIVFDSVSRMSRNSDEGIDLYMELFNQGIELVFLKEPYINTKVFRSKIEQAAQIPDTNNKAYDFLMEGIRKMLMELAKDQIRIAFDQAEKEVMDLRQRTKEGVERARRDGKQIGQVKDTKLITAKSLKCKQIIKKHSVDFGGSLSNSETMKLCQISNKTYYKYLNQLKSELNVN